MPNSSSNSRNHCIVPVASMPTTSRSSRAAYKLAYCIPIIEKRLRGELAGFHVHHSTVCLFFCVQIAALLIGYRKVHLVRCEADCRYDIRNTGNGAKRAEDCCN